MRLAVFQDRAQDTLARSLLARVTPAQAAITDTGVEYVARNGHRHQIITLAADFYGSRLDVLYVDVWTDIIVRGPRKVRT